MWPTYNAVPGVICGLSLLLVLVLAAPRVFLRVLRFSSLHKNTPNSNSARIEDPHENQLRLADVASSLNVVIYSFIFTAQ